jgi:hypothetical protein
LEKKRFGNFRFSSGTPTFLVKLLIRQPDFASDMLFSQERYLPCDDFDAVSVNNLPLDSLLLQTGYLTVGRVQ